MSEAERLIDVVPDPGDDAATPPATHDLLNRELSWLDFNDRVLTLATEPGIPLLERVKFCAIFSSNLDEFFQVRIAALHDQIAAKSPKTLRIGKAAFYAQAEMRLADAYDYAARVMVENLMTRDANEGIGAFVEKRTPEWEGLDAPEATE